MQEGDLYLCTVGEIHGTTVFVSLPDGKRGTITTSEIAPGRIKNIRQYVVPKKKIVCKILRIKGNNIDLSLRRVTSKEKQEIMNQYKQEQQAKSAIHQILKDKAEKTETTILKDFKSLADFFNKAREDPKLITKYIPKQAQEQITKITQKKRKEIQVTKIINLKCTQDDGVKKIKKIFEVKNPNLKTTYISAGTFQITLKGKEYKQTNKEIDKIVEQLEKSAKQDNCEFEVSEKK